MTVKKRKVTSCMSVTRDQEKLFDCPRRSQGEQMTSDSSASDTQRSLSVCSRPATCWHWREWGHRRHMLPGAKKNIQSIFICIHLYSILYNPLTSARQQLTFAFNHILFDSVTQYNRNHSLFIKVPGTHYCVEHYSEICAPVSRMSHNITDWC